MGAPGFTAEATLYQASGHYRTGGDFHQAGGALLPAQASSDCFGTTAQCRQNFCDGLTGRERAQCFAACARPTVCGPCVCRCSPDCTRTCSIIPSPEISCAPVSRIVS